MSDAELQRGTYVESTVIMTTVRVIVPFVFTFGLYVMFHGAESAGGGFQGGAIVASGILMLAFAFGIEPTRGWLSDGFMRSIVAGGGGAFALIGIGAVVSGGAFLDYAAYEIHHGVKYGIELVELGIGAVVSGVIVALFLSLAAGFDASGFDDEAAETDGGEEA
ncbi:MnhB domain-containing protein [Halopelagius longus]|uniref:Cation:proton antiporter n=1 Tax=Halopelagius longus TaxID=1236180 RepID=A0A1H1BYY6_9EURY|nr:MnhB domain-containing protein [Halopelagius longus]RDI70988.1 cation:proton antiporter [Halopelagius longus]SDQ57163.1 multisubunit sodium/proton antiporter, MrpB subunit [Halopelagius longus]